MARKVVSLYIDDSEIRLLVMRGKEVLDWGELRLEPGMVEGSEIVKEAEVAEKLKLIMRQFRIGTKRVTIGISGLFCLSRPAVLPQLPGAMLEEAVQREAKRLLPIPPEQCYLSWQITPGPPDKTQVFMVAVPRRVADSLFRTLRQAGLKPYHLEIKPLALARLSTEENAVIIDLQERELNIVVLSRGIPQPIRTVSLPESTLSDAERTEHIVDDIDRTLKFFNANNPERPIDSHVPLFVSGQFVTQPELYEPLTREFRMTASELQFPVRSPAGFKPDHYLVNIGMALHGSLAAKRNGSAVSLNCLPEEYVDKPIQFRRVMALPVAVVVLGLLSLLIFMVYSASGTIDSLHNEINNANRLVVLKTSIRKDLTDNITALEKKSKEVNASLTIFSAAGTQLQQDRDSTNGDLDIGTAAAPENVSLTSITYSANRMIIHGKALDETAIFTYARNLEESARFSGVGVTSILSTDNITLDFTLTMGL